MNLYFLNREDPLNGDSNPRRENAPNRGGLPRRGTVSHISSREMGPQRATRRESFSLGNLPQANLGIPGNSHPDTTSSFQTTQGSHDYVKPPGQIPICFPKPQGALITTAIRKNIHKKHWSSVQILEMACQALKDTLRVDRSVEDCWLYWSYLGRAEGGVDHPWPDNKDAVDDEVKRYMRDIRTSQSMARPNIRRYSLWSKDFKNRICREIKERQMVQCRVSEEQFWEDVGTEVAKSGFSVSYSELREYWVNEGRKEFGYDEMPWFGVFTKIKFTSNNITANMNKNNARRQAQFDDAKRHTSDTQLGPNKAANRGRGQTSGQSAREQREPRTPKAPAMQTATDLYRYASSRNKNRDHPVANRASDYPIKLVKPSRREKFAPFGTEAEPNAFLGTAGPPRNSRVPSSDLDSEAPQLLTPPATVEPPTSHRSTMRARRSRPSDESDTTDFEVEQYLPVFQEDDEEQYEPRQESEQRVESEGEEDDIELEVEEEGEVEEEIPADPETSDQLEEGDVKEEPTVVPSESTSSNSDSLVTSSPTDDHPVASDDEEEEVPQPSQPSNDTETSPNPSPSTTQRTSDNEVDATTSDEEQAAVLQPSQTPNDGPSTSYSSRASPPTNDDSALSDATISTSEDEMGNASENLPANPKGMENTVGGKTKKQLTVAPSASAETNSRFSTIFAGASLEVNNEARSEATGRTGQSNDSLPTASTSNHLSTTTARINIEVNTEARSEATSKPKEPTIVSPAPASNNSRFSENDSTTDDNPTTSDEQTVVIPQSLQTSTNPQSPAAMDISEASDDEMEDAPQASQSLVGRTSSSHRPETPPLDGGNVTSSDDEMEDAPQTPQETPFNAGILMGNAGHYAEVPLNRLGRAESRISHLQRDLREAKQEQVVTKKKLVNADKEINKLILQRDVLKTSHSKNMVEIQKLEERLLEEENYKKSLIEQEATENLEG